MVKAEIEKYILYNYPDVKSEWVGEKGNEAQYLYVPKGLMPEISEFVRDNECIVSTLGDWNKDIDYEAIKIVGRA
ncbi:hypothetical protein [Paenibacillus macquariensis]|uniref:Uncharacterized protein n=1 Tax=Paenibacillus macquariensis TaxID=948756 RepID=A0ABY1JKD7_9BACL|nr:hypothetical protein [Paenibacillus macquariensis]MEC0089909.1 hypothetical protein [Paenibacillus macquariensis]OAB31199.1 hypothetical protein PMSM_20995 [Paenibacillus macquariensis subsp. macquariensis]SIQ34082.1 hypothetical protein SAMN05421578_101295 [Paenibacillus macquariensis]